jgi:flagella synthesis protein FlgN
MADLEAALRDLQARLTEFTVVLEAEAKALETLQTDDLGLLAEKKNQLSAAVALAWSRLMEATRGDSQLREEVERGISSVPARERTWREIRRLARLAAQINTTNGQLIEAQLRRTRQALDILQQASKRGGLYGADGQLLELLGVTSHSLDKA